MNLSSEQNDFPQIKRRGIKWYKNKSAWEKRGLSIWLVEKSSDEE